MKTEAQTLHCIHFTRAEDPDSFAEAMDIRTKVFVEEQKVPAELERDEYDEAATHFLLLEKGEPVATGRVVDFQDRCQSRPVAKIGRVAVLSEHREQGFGEFLMWKILDYAREQGYEQAVLDSQTQAVVFYENLGFEKEGFEFEDAGIPHLAMRRVL